MVSSEAPARQTGNALAPRGPVTSEIPWRGPALLLILVVASWLRWIRWDLRFNQILFAYAAYYQPVVSAFASGDWYRAWTTFVGLHPPLYSVLFAVLYHLWGAPGGYLLASGALSVAAVGATYLLGKEVGGTPVGLGGAALMAVSVYQLHYALEVNDYPLSTLVATLGAWTFVRAIRRPERARLAGWTVTLVAGLYTHALFAVVVAAQVVVFVAVRGRAVLPRVAMVVGAATLLGLPLVSPVLSLVSSQGTYQNEPVPVSALWTSVVRVMAWRFGPAYVALSMPALAVAGAVRGLRSSAGRLETLALVPSLVVVPVVALLILGRVASAEQYPYYLSCLGPFLVLVAMGVLGPRRDLPLSHSRPWGALVLGLVCAVELAFGIGEVREARKAVADFHRTPHAIHRVAAGGPPAGVLWLIAPPLHGDDDKLAVDPVYLELPGWRACRYYGLDLGFEFVNYAFGQPYRCGDLILHTFTDIYPAEMRFWLDHYQRRGDPVSIVMYDVVTSPSYVPRMEAVLRPFPVAHRVVGSTHLFRVAASRGQRKTSPR